MKKPMARSPYEGFNPDDPKTTYTALPESRLTQPLMALMGNPRLASIAPMLARAHADDRFEASSLARRQMEQLFYQLLAEKRIDELLDPDIEKNVLEIRRAEDVALRITHFFPGEPKMPHECEENTMARIMMSLRKHFENAVFVCMRWSLKKRGLLTPANLCHWKAENAERDEAEALRMIIEFGGA